MPIEWTEKKTEETRKQLRTGVIEDGTNMWSEPATLDDLAAAIRGLSPGDRALLLQLTPIEPCLGCKKTMGDMERDLTDARTALESTRAEAERLRAKLEARTQELDNQKAEIDRLKANQIPIEVEPEWVRRIPEWAKEGMRCGLHDYCTNLEPPDLAELAALEAVHAMGCLMHKQNDAALPHLRDSFCYALRAAYLARKAGGE